MRPYSLALLILSSTSAFAGEGILGTRTGADAIPTSSASAVGPMAMVQMVLALAVVLALVKWVMPKVISRLNKRILPSIGGGIRIEESAAFAGGNLYIVTAKKKSLLLSVSSSGVTCLADVTDPEPDPNLPTFQELVDKAPGVPPGNSEDALERLLRLTK